jgi:hypothetical protein
MRYDGIFDELRARLAARYGEPIIAAVMVHRSPDQPRGGPKLRTNNQQALTPTTLRLCGLGGRTGVKLKDDIAAWDRRTVALHAYDAERSTWFNTTMSHHSYGVHSLRITGPEGALVVDVMAENPFMDPAAEICVLLNELGRPAAA